MPKIIDYTRTQEADFLRKILEKPVGEKVFIPRDSKFEAGKLVKTLNHCAEKLKIHNVLAQVLYRSNSWWVELQHKQSGIIYTKLADGTIKKEQIDPERQRMLKLLIEDGYDLERINQVVDPKATLQELAAISPLAQFFAKGT